MVSTNTASNNETVDLCLLVFLRRQRLRVSNISKGLRIEPLPICVEKTQMRWFGHLIRMSPDHFPSEVFQVYPFWRRPQDRTRTCWMDYISNVAKPPGGAAGHGCKESGLSNSTLLGLLPLQVRP